MLIALAEDLVSVPSTTADSSQPIAPVPASLMPSDLQAPGKPVVHMSICTYMYIYADTYIHINSKIAFKRIWVWG